MTLAAIADVPLVRFDTPLTYEPPISLRLSSIVLAFYILNRFHEQIRKKLTRFSTSMTRREKKHRRKQKTFFYEVQFKFNEKDLHAMCVDFFKLIRWKLKWNRKIYCTIREKSKRFAELRTIFRKLFLQVKQAAIKPKSYTFSKISIHSLLLT